MFCNKCGTKLDEDSRFCSVCGAKVAEIEARVTDNVTDGDVLESVDNREDLLVEDKKAIPNEEMIDRNVHKKRGYIFAVIGIGVIAIIICCIIGLVKLSAKSTYVDSKSQCNFNNTAHFAYDDSSLYFIAKYNDSDSETSLYSTSYNGTNKKLIAANNDIARIRISNKKIIYAEYADDDYCIGMMNKDGTEDVTIVTLERGTDDMLAEFDIYNNYLYYIYNSEVHECSLTGEADEVILSDVKDFVIAGKYMYYSSNSIISSYDLKKKVVVELCSADADALVYDNGKIYYTTDKGLYYVSALEPGTAQRIVDDSQISDYVIDGEVIYYLSMLETDDIVSLAEYMADDGDNDSLMYALMMVNAGELKRVNKNGGDEATQASDQLLMFTFFGYPQGFYCKVSAFADNLAVLELE